MLIGSYPDVPPKLSEELEIPDPMKMPGAGRMLETDMPEPKIVKRKFRKDLTKKERKKKEKKKKRKKEKERVDKEKRKAIEREIASAQAATAAMNPNELGNLPLMIDDAKREQQKAKMLAAEIRDHKNQLRAEGKLNSSSDDQKPDPDLEPLHLPRGESDNTDSQHSDSATNPIAGIDDNNILGDQYFEVKSEHCLMPLLPQVNSYNRNMVLSMGHSGVKHIIEKVSYNLE